MTWAGFRHQVHTMSASSQVTLLDLVLHQLENIQLSSGLHVSCFHLKSIILYFDQGQFSYSSQWPSFFFLFVICEHSDIQVNPEACIHTNWKEKQYNFTKKERTIMKLWFGITRVQPLWKLPWLFDQHWAIFNCQSLIPFMSLTHFHTLFPLFCYACPLPECTLGLRLSVMMAYSHWWRTVKSSSAHALCEFVCVPRIMTDVSTPVPFTQRHSELKCVCRCFVQFHIWTKGTEGSVRVNSFQAG